MRLTLKSAYPAIFETHPPPWYKTTDEFGRVTLKDANYDVIATTDSVTVSVILWLFELYLFVMPLPEWHQDVYRDVLPVTWIPRVLSHSPLPWIMPRRSPGLMCIYDGNGNKVSQWYAHDVVAGLPRIALYELSLRAERKLGIRRT